MTSLHDFNQHNPIIQDNVSSFCHRDGRFDSKVGQIGPKWDKSGAFSDQISVHLARSRQMHWNLIWKSPGFVQFGVQSDPISSQTYHPWIIPLVHVSSTMIKSWNVLHGLPTYINSLSCDYELK